MATSIVKLSKSFFVKVLVGIIILPFVFWGMGDVFRGGNQNVIATIDSKKVSTQEFMSYLNRLNLNDQQIKNIKKTDLIENILTEYIGRKVMSLEIENSGIVINDNSLRNIIKNDKLFLKDNKFSRIEYEKFLLKSGITAPSFEKNIVEQESRRQFLSFMSGGLTIPDILINEIFKRENQVKKIRFIDLDRYHSKTKPPKKKIDELYEKNKDFFIEEFKSIEYAEITPKLLNDSSEYDELFFKKLDVIENKVLDGQSFADTVKENNLKIITIKKVNATKQNENGKKIENLTDDFFKKLYFKKQKNSEIIKADNKYFLAQIKFIEKKQKTLKDKKVLEAIKKQLNLKTIIENNTTLSKDISLGGFDQKKIETFAKKNGLELKDYEISNLKQNEIFAEGIIKRIFLIKDGEVNLITNSSLSESFLVLAVKTKYKELKRSSNEFEQYEAKTRLDLVNKIYRTFDSQLNQKYNVKINQKTVDRVKSSF